MAHHLKVKKQVGRVAQGSMSQPFFLNLRLYITKLLRKGSRKGESRNAEEKPHFWAPPSTAKLIFVKLLEEQSFGGTKAPNLPLFGVWQRHCRIPTTRGLFCHFLAIAGVFWEFGFLAQIKDRGEN